MEILDIGLFLPILHSPLLSCHESLCLYDVSLNWDFLFKVDFDSNDLRACHPNMNLDLGISFGWFFFYSSSI